MKKRLVGLTIFLLTLVISSSLFAQAKKRAKDFALKKSTANSKSFKTCLILQPRFYWFDSQSKKSKSSGSEFYIRLARFTLRGQVSNKINFFFGLINKDFGRAGDNTVSAILRDAWIEYDFSEAFKINAGLMKLPYSRHMQQNFKRLHGLDFHGFFLANTGIFNHRDIGIALRGLLAKQKIDYRLGVVNGEQIAGKIGGDKHLRYVGRLGFNVFEAEPEYFWAGTYLGKRKVLSFGVSFDMEPGVGGSDGKSLYHGFAIDAFADIPVGHNGIVASLNAYKFNEGTARMKGSGLWGDLGYRIKKIEPLIGIEWYKPESGDKGKRVAILPGLNYWINGYSANVKAEFGLVKLNNAEKWDKTFIVQSQLAFSSK